MTAAPLLFAKSRLAWWACRLALLVGLAFICTGGPEPMLDVREVAITTLAAEVRRLEAEFVSLRAPSPATEPRANDNDGSGALR
jgi:hypothetical protein